jgi:hypothetical protein
VGVQRGVDLQPLTLQPLVIELGAEVALDAVDEVRRVDPLDGPVLDGQRLVQRARELFGRDPLVRVEQAEHQVAAASRGLDVAERRVVTGRRDDPGEERRLAQCQLAHVLAEVVRGRLAHAVDGDRSSLAQVDLVQVGLEDLLLRVVPLEQHRHHRLARLAPQRAFG